MTIACLSGKVHGKKWPVLIVGGEAVDNNGDGEGEDEDLEGEGEEGEEDVEG